MTRNYRLGSTSLDAPRSLSDCNARTSCSIYVGQAIDAKIEHSKLSFANWTYTEGKPVGTDNVDT